MPVNKFERDAVRCRQLHLLLPFPSASHSSPLQPV